MPTYSQETQDGMAWIQAAFWGASHRMNKPYQWCNWQGFTYYVLLEGEEQRRHVDFTQSQIDACASDGYTQERWQAEDALERMLQLAEPGGIEL